MQNVSDVVFRVRQGEKPFDGDLVVFLALPKAHQDEDPRIATEGMALQIPTFKRATNEGEGVYKIRLIQNKAILPRGTKYVVFADRDGKEPENCASFVADAESIELDIKVRP